MAVAVQPTVQVSFRLDERVVEVESFRRPLQLAHLGTKSVRSEVLLTLSVALASRWEFLPVVVSEVGLDQLFEAHHQGRINRAVDVFGTDDITRCGVAVLNHFSLRPVVSGRDQSNVSRRRLVEHAEKRPRHECAAGVEVIRGSATSSTWRFRHDTRRAGSIGSR